MVFFCVSHTTFPGGQGVARGRALLHAHACLEDVCLLRLDVSFVFGFRFTGLPSRNRKDFGTGGSFSLPGVLK